MRLILLFLMLVPYCQNLNAYEVQTKESMVSSTPIYPAKNLKTDNYCPGTDWKLAWADEFESETLDEANWNRQVLPAGQFNEEWQSYTKDQENAYIQDGCLVIKAVHTSDRHGLDQYTSARLNTAGKQAWTYGKVAARMQLPHGKGMWPAFWMLGANCIENGGDTEWPQCGEIDIMELYGTKSDAAAEANIHFAGLDGNHQQMGAIPFMLSKGKFADAFHVFEIEWDESQIAWKIDGHVYATANVASEDKSEFHRPFFILLNIAVGGSWAGRPDASTQFPQFMYVDWVRVYQRKNS